MKAQRFRTLKKKVNTTVTLAGWYLKKYQLYVLFSGGKDSLVALDLVHTASSQADAKVRVIHVDTTVETPGNIEYVKQICDSYKLELILLRSRQNYFDMVKRYGFPTVKRRWCKWRLKIRPVRNFVRKLENVMLVDGLRQTESSIRKRLAREPKISPRVTFHRFIKCPIFHPILDWTLDDVYGYLELRSLKINPLYSSYGRVFDCWCTVYKTPSNPVMLKYNHPDLFDQLLELERTLRVGGSALYDYSRKNVYSLGT